MAGGLTQLPQPRPWAQQLVYLDLKSARAETEPADHSGAVTATFDEVEPGRLWVVNRLTVSIDGDECSAYVYVGEATARGLVDWTPAGNLDISAGVGVYVIEAGRSLIVRWTDTVTAGAVGIASIDYHLATRAGAYG